MPASGMPRHAGEELTMVRISRSDWILAWNRDLRPVALASLTGFQLLKQRICPIRRHSLHRQNFFAWQLVRQSDRSEEHTSELQSLMRISYAVFCLQKKKQTH